MTRPPEQPLISHENIISLYRDGWKAIKNPWRGASLKRLFWNCLCEVSFRLRLVFLFLGSLFLCWHEVSSVNNFSLEGSSDSNSLPNCCRYNDATPRY